MSNVITPNMARTIRKAIREIKADLHQRALHIRALRQSGRILDREDGRPARERTHDLLADAKEIAEEYAEEFAMPCCTGPNHHE